ncbi:hypothetical protein SAMN05661099_0853 [Daejeonella lutea]|uniref:DUF4380 domain-containing protein n=2 Tax=Daejeonella lutea TaxID=572036 RepID=A0A1T5ALP7_9SPHI|nr:hypothetical protein SAMN05661099_0853 [Daejeonella lutea]
MLLSALEIFAQHPETTISNGLIEAKLYLPDATNGFYRATRFDWAGVVSSLKYKNHEYFGQWYAKHDPKVHDAIQGPVEAFDPIGYDAVKPGESFVKIGVGSLKKINANPYRFSSPFEIVNAGEWKVKKKKNAVTFVHELHDANGYAYIYTKTLRLLKNKPVLVLEHSLKNIGKNLIETSTFNHNFFVIDKQPTGPDFTVTLPFEINNQSAGKNLMKFENKQMNYLKVLTKGESTMEYPKGFTGDRVEDYDFTVANSRTGASVRITADKPLSNFMYWSVPTTLSPEPFIKIKALPGETFKWNINYEFSSIN